MNKNYLEKYARLVIKSGVNIQNNQILVINSPIECAEFTRMLSEIAYKEGAREVVIYWNDEISEKVKLLYGKDELFDEFPEWRKELYVGNVRKGAAFITIDASDPDLMMGVNPERISRTIKSKMTALAEWRQRLMADQNVWCVVSMPTKAWAMKVFPGVSEAEAVEKLWDAIFVTVRAKASDPVAAWEEHKNTVNRRTEFLTKNKFKYFTYKNSIGTDLKVEFPKNNLWLGPSSTSPEGTEFIANIPTEEAFTLPLKTGVNGKVVSSKPLNYNGTLIENFSFTFENGRIVDFTAEKGYDALKQLIGTDEGSHYLGEVALVPFDSPISNLNILFYNTLFDENASCHFAIGEAYPTCLKDGNTMTKEQLEKLGVNDSLEHVDFMIGTSDLSIIGVTEDGREIEIFKDGNFAF